MNLTTAMNSIVDTIKQLSKAQADSKSLKDKLGGKMDIILSAGKNIESPGRSLLQKTITDLTTTPNCSFGVGILLAAQAESLPDSCVRLYLRQCKLFFTTASSEREKLLLSQKEVITICQKLANLSNRANQPRAVTRTLMQATLLSAPSSTILTPIHSIFLQNCLSGKMYSLAVDFLLENEILEISPADTFLSAQDYLEFFYYAGLCFIGMRNYTLALDYFLQAITLPAQALSAIVVAAVKASRLVSLIDSGSAFELPKYASHLVARFVKQDMPVYDAIAKNFILNDLTLLAECVESGAGVLMEDHNYGLAKEVISSLTRHNIKKLTSTYITLSLHDVAVTIGSKDLTETEELLFQMISSNEIKAVIDQQTSMIIFNHSHDENQNQTPLSCAQKMREKDVTILKLEAHINNTIAIGEKLRDMQHRILTSEEYISRSLKHFQSGSVIAHGDSSGWTENDSLGDFLKHPSI